jgi:crotonobetainyl-CoA:carnitine CoA-transferase CaiB-like acyl-CoA transferase
MGRCKREGTPKDYSPTQAGCSQATFARDCFLTSPYFPNLMQHATSALEAVWASAGGDPEHLDDISLTGVGSTADEEYLPSVFRVGAAATASTAAATAAVRQLWRLRGNNGAVEINARHASVAFRSERHLTIDGATPPSPWAPLSGYYKTADGWIQLHCNFEHHADRVIEELGTSSDRDAVKASVGERGRFELEDALAGRGACATAFRSQAEWETHDQGLAVAALPMLELIQIGEAPPRPVGEGPRPLDGVRVLDLTRIIAGPVAGRFLASHGATVMRVGASHLPVIGSILGDTTIGKLSTDLDIRAPDQHGLLRSLTQDADVFVQGYRPGGLEALGFGPEAVAEQRPGIVYASLSAFGHVGPWAGRRGFDSLVQTASGICWSGMEAHNARGPRPLPCQALDHASGYLLAFGVAMALHRRATVGGSWHVRLSLAQTGRWIQGLGRHDGLDLGDPTDVDDLLIESVGPLGRVGVVAPIGGITGAHPRWDLPAPVPGSSPPRWP